MSDTTPTKSKAERQGRLVGLSLFGLVVGAFTVVCSAQIIHAVWFRTVPAPVSCRAGIDQLIEAVKRARSAARETDGEAQALARFRHAVDPAWEYRSGLSSACRSDKLALSALKTLDQLRYAEEHAVRYEARNLARQRRRLRELEAKLLSNISPESSP